MEEKKKERLSKVRDIKNNLILDAGLQIFSAKGYYDTRLEDIAAVAGFSKASLYNYYNDKETIFFALALREYEKITERLASDATYSLSPHQSFKTNLSRYIRAILETFRAYFSFMLTLDEMQFLSVFNPDTPNHLLASLKSDLRNEKRSLKDELMQIIDWARAEKTLTSSLETARISSYIEGLLFGLFREWRKAQEMHDIDAAIDELLLFICQGARAKHEQN